jgi:hypothetical protein
MNSQAHRSDNLFVSSIEGSLPARVVALLNGRNRHDGDAPFELDSLALVLGQRLPDQAQTMTYWQRGELGRALRSAGYGVRVEQGRVIFVPRVNGGR